MTAMAISETEFEFELPTERPLTANDLALAGLPTRRPLTVDDLARTPDDGRTYELVDGRLDVSAAPAQPHTRAETRLAWHLTTVAPVGFEVQSGPGITFNGQRTHHRVPDLAVKLDGPLERPYLTKPPLLAVEVLSPESVFRDTNRKRQEYAAFGIESYWIINPSLEKPGILALRLEDGQYREVAQVYGPEALETDLPFPVRIVPEWLIADGNWKTGIGGSAEEEEQEPPSAPPKPSRDQ